jgi:hypothetical protein
MGRREKPLDPAAGAVQRFAYDLRRLRDEAGTPTYRAMAARAGYSGPTLSAAAAGERLPTLPVLLAYVTACGGDSEEWTRRWHEAVAGNAAPPGPADAESPYPGLARFDGGDRYLFHGRADLVAELLELTVRKRVSAVVGASGIGKSSLLRAGLVPALRDIGDGARHLAAVRLLTPTAILAGTHEDLFAPHSAPGDTLLVVDQFEEIFAHGLDRAERELFVGRLLSAADPASRLRVVLAVRADFYGRCAEHGPLAEALRDSTLLVGPMSPQQLREAVVRPAAARRLVVERALTARIVADVTGEPGGLPLMAHALREVWRRRTGRTLTLAAYEALGGVRGAVAHTAEAVHAAWTPTERTAARALLSRLVNPGDGTADTGRPVDRAELDGDPATGPVLERLVRARLLTVDGDTVQLAHEALLTAWPRLRGWVDEDRERLRAHRLLTRAAGAWAEVERDEGSLYRGVRLTEAREAFPDGSAGRLSVLEREFLAASIEADERERAAANRAARRTRVLTGALAVLLCLCVTAGLAAWRQSEVNARGRDEAEARRAVALADGLRAAEPRTAMRLALAAWATADLPETRQALRTAATQSEQDVFVQPEENGRAVNAPAWLSRDGRILTTVVRDRVTQWDVTAHRRLRSDRFAGLSEGVVDVRADGRLIAHWSAGRRDLLVSDLVAGGTRRLLAGPATDTDGAFGPSGKTFVVRRLMDGRATAQVRDVGGDRPLIEDVPVADGGALPALSADDRYLAWCSEGGERLNVLDVATRRPVAGRVPHATRRALCAGESLTFTPDRRAVAAATAEGVVTWDFRAGRERTRMPTPTGAHLVEFAGPYALVRSPGSLALWRAAVPHPTDDGRPPVPLLTFPASGLTVGDIRLDLRAGVLRYRESRRTSIVRTLSLHGLARAPWRVVGWDRDNRPAVDEPPPSGGGFALDLDGRVVLTAEGVLRDLRAGTTRQAVTGEDHLAAGAVTRDGRLLAVSDVHGRLTLWDVRERRRIAVLRAVDPTTDRTALGFSRNGSLLAAGSSDGTVRIWETAAPRVPAAVVPVGDVPLRGVGFVGSGWELAVDTAHTYRELGAMSPAAAVEALCACAGGGPGPAEWRRYLPSVPHRDVCRS